MDAVTDATNRGDHLDAPSTLEEKMTQQYRDALLEYLALSHLEDELRGTSDYELRNQVSGRRSLAREKLEKILSR